MREEEVDMTSRKGKIEYAPLAHTLTRTIQIPSVVSISLLLLPDNGFGKDSFMTMRSERMFSNTATPPVRCAWSVAVFLFVCRVLNEQTNELMNERINARLQNGVTPSLLHFQSRLQIEREMGAQATKEGTRQNGRAGRIDGPGREIIDICTPHTKNTHGETRPCVWPGLDGCEKKIRAISAQNGG